MPGEESVVPGIIEKMKVLNIFPSVSWGVPDHYVFTTLNPRGVRGRPKGEVEMTALEMVWKRK